MHYFLIAGEPSGDLHGSYLVEALKRLDPDAIFTFLGGDIMARAAGCKPVIHYNRMAFMGFSEVLRNLSTISANFSAAKQAIELASPDCLILIDYPSFNLKMAAFAHKLSIPVYYYISPKIWAWKKWRVRDIRRNVRMVFSILPFEPEFYRRHKAEAVYVGNPSVAEVDAQLAQAATRQEFLAANNLPDRPLVALMPGSRRNEILNNLAIMQAAMARFPRRPARHYRRPRNSRQPLCRIRSRLHTRAQGIPRHCHTGALHGSPGNIRHRHTRNSPRCRPPGGAISCQRL